MNGFVVDLITKWSYFGLFLGMIIEAVVIIIPSELILATGGILAGQGYLSFWLVFITGLIGSVFCAIIIYLMGYYGGRPFALKYGKYFFMKTEDIEASDAWFRKYGMIAALISRNFPIVRTLISLPIGIARLSFWKFVTFTTIGSIPWTFLFVYAGFALGDNWHMVADVVDSFKIPIIIILTTLVVLYLYKKIKPKFVK